jgi:hypothetical protein
MVALKTVFIYLFEEQRQAPHGANGKSACTPEDKRALVFSSSIFLSLLFLYCTRPALRKKKRM